MLYIMLSRVSLCMLSKAFLQSTKLRYTDLSRPLTFSNSLIISRSVKICSQLETILPKLSLFLFTTSSILFTMMLANTFPDVDKVIPLSHAGGTVHQTFNSRWPCLPSGFGMCVEQPAVVCQECTVADDVPSRAEDCTFPVVVWQWLGDRDCTAQYNCCLPATWLSAILSFLFAFLFNCVRCPCNVFDVMVSP